jgi:hypothetical protein
MVRNNKKMRVRRRVVQLPPGTFGPLSIRPSPETLRFWGLSYDCVSKRVEPREAVPSRK